MVKINKIYTRSGDQGETHLVGGAKVAKDSPRVAAYGDIDELNSVVGMVRALAEKTNIPELCDKLLIVQNELFDLGFDLARRGYPWADKPPGWELEEP